MNKTELIAKMSEKSGLNKKEAEAALNAFMETVGETLKNKEKIQLIGFGSFLTRERAAKEVRNPRNPEQKVSVPATVAPVFKPGSKLKDIINGK